MRHFALVSMLSVVVARPLAAGAAAWSSLRPGKTSMTLLRYNACAVVMMLTIAGVAPAAEYPGDLVTSKTIPRAPQPGSVNFVSSALPVISISNITPVTPVGSKGTFSFTFSWRPARITDQRTNQLFDWIWYGYRATGCTVQPGNPDQKGGSVAGIVLWTFPEPPYQVVATCGCGRAITVSVAGAPAFSTQRGSQPVSTTVPAQNCLTGK
jgi:hypothetical protein